MRDFISIFDNALSSDECKQIIEHFESFAESDYDKKGMFLLERYICLLC